MLISPVWNKILKVWDIFELMQIEVQCSKNYFKFFLPQEARSFENNIENKTQEPRPKLKKNIHVIYLNVIFAVPVIQCQ